MVQSCVPVLYVINYLMYKLRFPSLFVFPFLVIQPRKKVLNKAVEKAFKETWRDLMGFDFPSKPLFTKGETLRNWPTIIFQLHGSSVILGDEEFNKDLHNVQNKAVVLDPPNPNDILIAFPPSHYMSYSLINQTYFSRLEFMDDDTYGS